MPICPMCHSKLTRDLHVSPSILPDRLWRCEVCCDVWSERVAIQPSPEPPPSSSRMFLDDNR